jgi:glutamyl-Q tRNA(Asp) synthetase
MHLPIALGTTGLKLSKSEDAPALSHLAPAAQVVAVLEFLHQEPPAELARAPLAVVWQWASTHWQPGRFAGMKTGTAGDLPAGSDARGNSPS